MHALLLAYHFPPLGGGGTQRGLKVVRYLPEFGCAVTVVTGCGGATGRWSPPDETLLSQVGDADVRRVTSREPGPDSRGRARLQRWLGVAAPWSRWWSEGALMVGLCSGARPDVVLATMPPFATAPAAVRLSRALRCPWVADLRDPWALDEMAIYPTKLHRRRELARMRRLLGTAAAVVANTPEAGHRLEHLLPGPPDGPRVAVIPNGFDRGDFVSTPPAPRRDDVFRIVHTGTLHTDLGREQRGARLRRRLGGEVEGVDILTRSHVYLLEAVDRLLVSDPGLRSRIEVLLAGVLSPSDQEAASRCPVVTLAGYQPHAATVALLRSADLLFLPMQNLPPGKRATIVPGKTYEYLAAERPILAAVPEGDARELLLRAGTAHVCAPDDVESMVAAIEAELAGRGGLRGHPPADLLRRYERRALTAELALLLESVTARRDEAGARSASPMRSSPAAAPTGAGR